MIEINLNPRECLTWEGNEPVTSIQFKEEMRGFLASGISDQWNLLKMLNDHDGLLERSSGLCCLINLLSQQADMLAELAEICQTDEGLETLFKEMNLAETKGSSNES